MNTYSLRTVRVNKATTPLCYSIICNSFINDLGQKLDLLVENKIKWCIVIVFYCQQRDRLIQIEERLECEWLLLEVHSEIVHWTIFKILNYCGFRKVPSKEPEFMTYGNAIHSKQHRQVLTLLPISSIVYRTCSLFPYVQ